jgi:DNA-binding NarL/FixJ family response regulator
VDDDHDVTFGIETMLSTYQVRVIRDCSGAQGIWDALQLKPDLIITDLRMAQGSGEDLLDTVRGNEQTRHIPIIILTGRPGSHLPGQLRKRGADGFLRKPAHFTTLLSEIREFIPLIPRDEANALRPD